jgi:hypothetical protein
VYFISLTKNNFIPDFIEKADSIPFSIYTENSDAKFNSEKLYNYHKNLFVSTAKNQYHADLLDQQIAEYYKTKNDFKTLEPDSKSMAKDLDDNFKQLLKKFGEAMAEDESVKDNYDEHIGQLNAEMQNSGRERDQNLEILVERLQSIGLTLQSSKNGQYMSEKVLLQQY